MKAEAAQLVPLTTAELRGVEVLADLSQAELAWLAAHAELREYDGGEVVVNAGDPADHMHLLLRGGVEYTGEQGGQALRYLVRQGEVGGMLPQSRMTHFPSTGRALGPTRLAQLHRSQFPQLAAALPELEGRLLAVMTRRIRDSTHAEEQRERLSALGRLSAGLAHELNNPAAAVRRDAADLDARLAALPGLVTRLLAVGVDAAALARAEALVEGRRRTPLGTLAQADAEDELLELLEPLAVPDAAELAATLVEAGVRAGELGWLADAGDQAAPLLSYLNFRLGSASALADIGAAAGRISELVGAVKRYSHMDRGGDRQPTDVRVGLDSTLTMLGHKLRSRNIRVERDYQGALPKVTANEGELNQVWTNLIDNAADALAAGGTLRIGVSALPGSVQVSVQDDGPGIPAELQGRIFEPFFTTKGVGEGSGLGLDLVQRVVVRQHGGEVRVSSEPGRTEFVVLLPSQLNNSQLNNTESVAAQPVKREPA